jgi:hypothetical protein
MRIRLGPACVAAAIGLSGCATSAPPPVDLAPPTTAVETNPAMQQAPLPDPQTLIAVLVQLTDPAVPGAAKLHLIEGSGGADAARLDSLTRALQDTQSLPLTFAVNDLAWSDRHPGDVRGGVDMVAPPPKGGLLAFPMEFRPTPGGWQLTRDSADILMGVSPGSSAPTPAPPAPAPAAPAAPPAAPTPAAPAAPTPPLPPR